MQSTTNLQGEVRPAHTLTVPSTSTLVREPGAEPAHAGARTPRLSSADLHARRLAREAEAWLKLAQERGRMRPVALTRKALDALAFSVQHRTHAFAVPTKLAGTKPHQPALWRLLRERARPGHALAFREVYGGPIGVYHNGEHLGDVQTKHEGWLRPLIPFGARPYLLAVSGSEREGYTLGLNLAVGHVGAAVDALRHALGDGDGLAAPVYAPGTSRDGHGGDGRDGLAAPVPTVHVPCDPADVVLWRDERGEAQASVPHAVRHSPAGIEWGYLGSGPADLARSVLLYFAEDVALVEATYVRFKEEVVARVPREGGLIRAADVRAWLDERAAEHGA